MSNAVTEYLKTITSKFETGQAREHAYRTALERLIESFPDINAINDPKRSEHGAPDFVFIKKSNPRIFQGYAETKDVTANLDKVEKTNQMERYSGYDNLFLTDYLQFRFFRNGEKTTTVSLGSVTNNSLQLTPENGSKLYRELAAFLERCPEQIRSGKRLAVIMGGYARRVRDSVEKFLALETEKNASLEGVYDKMKELLVHDLTPEKFADMYAQTLVYGLFVGRYNDSSLQDFTRQEAQANIPRSNPFLRHFFDHIAGIEFDQRLAYIVDELCAVFAVSDVHTLIQKHLRLFSVENERDPLIHFYEDFLKEYDPGLRKSMGAYYTPTPVVRFIIREVDRILKEDFGIADGIASTETFEREVETQPWRLPGERKDRLTKTVQSHRVQILDPAVGTATFLNEIIKYIYEQKRETQAGQWPSYVREHLIPRLFGFELMMAPYTIAHLKLGMTLQETGVTDLGNERLNVYLTNTLEEGTPYQQRLELGLGQAIATESKLAADIKTTQPIMIVMGNPPYSGVSSNETAYANSLIQKYKVEPGGQQKLQERKHWLNDDYVKFMAFAEDMVERNGSGIVAMITNNGYLDNPTFRGMRWHLTQTFDKIYVLDLHGNAKKKETAPDGSKDENVFNIMQGVSILIAVKDFRNQKETAEVYHTEIYGKRHHKFTRLNAKNIVWSLVKPDEQNCLFIPKNAKGAEMYYSGIAIDELFKKNTTGIVTGIDRLSIFQKRDELQRVTSDILESPHRYEKYGIKDSRRASKEERVAELRIAAASAPLQIMHRPFDTAWMYYTKLPERWINSPRYDVMQHFMSHENLGLVSIRQPAAANPLYFDAAFVVDKVLDLNFVRRGSAQVFPLYLYHEDGAQVPNFNEHELSKLTENLKNTHSPEELLDYIYASLHSPNYREKYKEFLKTDFPRVPIPTQEEFDRLVPLGRRLRELHLMTSAESHETTTNYLVPGTNTVEKVAFQPEVKSPEAKDSSQTEIGRVYINDTQYFGNVPRLAWEFYIGGYQPAQKWLKDRRGHTLTSNDITHYQRIITILSRTHAIMQEIG